jgi:hypothetical protein
MSMEIHGSVLLEAILTCIVCEVDYEGRWLVPGSDVQDMVEAPVASQTCTGCGDRREVEYPGWSFRTEAG